MGKAVLLAWLVASACGHRSFASGGLDKDDPDSVEDAARTLPVSAHDDHALAAAIARARVYVTEHKLGDVGDAPVEATFMAIVWPRRWELIWRGASDATVIAVKVYELGEISAQVLDCYRCGTVKETVPQRDAGDAPLSPSVDPTALATALDRARATIKQKNMSLRGSRLIDARFHVIPGRARWRLRWRVSHDVAEIATVFVDGPVELESQECPCE